MRDRADVKVGFACNCRCVFCAQGDKRKEVKRVPFDDLVVRMKAAFAPRRELVLTGGEPTIRDDIVRVVRAARAIGYVGVQIQTNGRMLSLRPLVQRLLRAGVTEFSPALHGPSAEVHDALTRAPGSFEQTVAGISAVAATRAGLVTNTVVAKPNLVHLDATVTLLADLGVRRMQLAMVHPVGTAEARYEEVVPRLPEAAPFVRAAVQRGRRLGVSVMVEAMPACFMRGVQDALVEDTIPETTVVDLDGDPFHFSDWRREEGKVKGPPCEGCTKSRICEGPWREYPHRQGWDGYLPFG